MTPADKVMAAFRERLETQNKTLGPGYSLRMATWNLRLTMERKFPEEEWPCHRLRAILKTLCDLGLVSKCKHESRIGQAVWKLE